MFPIRSRIIILLSALLLSACETLPLDQLLSGGAAITQEQRAEAIRQTLEQGSRRASDELSQRGAYLDNPDLRIPLPQQMQSVANTMRQFGFSRHVDQLEVLMNRGAEQAAAKAGPIFIEAVRQMSIEDAIGIVRGPENAATQYFRQQTENRLRAEYQPVIRSNLEQLGFYDQYRLVLDVYSSLPVGNARELDLEQHALNLALDGLFSRVADEEQLIRADPFGRGGALIGAVFGR